MKRFFISLLILFSFAMSPLQGIVLATEQSQTTTSSQTADNETETTQTETEPETAEFTAAAKHVIAIEAKTGKILYEKDSQTVTGIASISKLLTAYLVYEAIAQNKTTPETTVNVSNYAYSLSLNNTIANVPLDARAYSVETLLEAVLVNSANGASVALAEHLGGTEAKFVDMMQKKLQEWGIQDATLVNASGLSNAYLGENIYPGSEENDENMMSARSVAVIAQRLLLDFPEVSESTSKLSAPWANHSMSTWNLLLKGAMYSRPTVDGLMTGTSELSGSSFVASSTENNMRVVTVLLGAENVDLNPHARFTATNELLNYLAQTYYMATLVEEGQTFEKSSAKIINGKVDKILPVAQSDFQVVQKADDVKLEATFKTDKQGYEATIKKGQEVGALTFVDDGYLFEPPSMPMVAKKEVPRSVFLKVWWNEFVNWVNEEL